MNILIIIICFVALIAGSYMDLKKREVADWLNFSLIISGILINSIFWVYSRNLNIILFSISGLIFSIILGYIMFYTGQWGGGDSKMMMGLGAMIGLSFGLDSFLIKFYINLLFAGSIYGLAWIAYLTIKHRKRLFIVYKNISERKKIRKTKKIVSIIVLVLLLILFFIPENYVDISSKLIFSAIMFFLYSFQFLWIFVKAIEKEAMIKKTDVDDLTEGDWIVKDVVVNKKTICGPKDLGIEKYQIKKLKKLKQKGKIKHVLIKQGIPFIPSFLIAFSYTLITKNYFFLDYLIQSQLF
ncbi:hypothetical protein GF327_00815 [Candidatus Woesearchaeota archaeon]|nr:hypothetical protein [Candidatus Woesearchaeota archaeon]